jgi:hypothetical protein
MSEEAKTKMEAYVETSFVSHLTGLVATRGCVASLLVIGAPAYGIDFFLRNFQSSTMCTEL